MKLEIAKNRTPTPVYLDPGMHPGLEVKGLNGVNQRPKSHTYILIKKTLNASEYVKSYMSKHKRSLMAQFLTGILSLKKEAGRLTL